MPNWGQGNPIVVGKKVFVVCEPGWKSDFPQLVCLDADTGKPVWQKEVNHWVNRPAAERPELEKVWHDRLELMRKCFRIYHQYILSGEKAWEGKPAEKMPAPWDGNYPGDREAASAAYAELGVRFTEGGPFQFGMKHVETPHVTSKLAQAEGLDLPAWWGGSILGIAIAGMTPVSDGRHIWMMTSQGVVACYDLDGNQKWLKTFCRDGAEARLHSPVLTEGVLALFFDKEALGLDAATGETKWKAKPSVGFERHQLFAMPLGRTGVVLAQGMIVRVADGKILSANYLAEFQAPHAFPMAVNREDGIVYVNGLFPGKHGLDTAALRLTVAGDQATVELAWKRDGRLGGVDRSNTLGMFSVCYSQGKLYAAGSEFVLDARTGAEVRLAPGTSIPSATRHLLIAGSHVVGVRSKMCWYESCGLEHKEPPRGCDVESRTLDGAPLGAGRLTVPAADTPEKRQQRIDLAAGIYWEFGRAAPFFAGDRIYIRSNDELLCIGKR